MSTATNPSTIADHDRWERDRLAALQRFDILDSPREEEFDRITRLIKSIFGVSIGIVSMIDGHRQWYKAVDGLPNDEVPRKDTFCRYALETGQPLVIEDASLDPRFAANPFVTDDPFVRFYASVPLATEDGHTIGTLCAIDSTPRKFTDRDLRILEDLARIAMNELELRQRATVDSLTGVLGRRSFKEEGARAISLAKRHDHPLACVCFDVDHFKKINDTFGHAGGDKALIAVTKACMALLRQSDLIGRLGGEEFAILLPYADREGALEVAEKLRSAISHIRIDVDGSPIAVTASFGVAVLDGAIGDIDTLLDNADSAVYAAKNAGRDRCHFYGSDGEKGQAPQRRVLKAARILLDDGSSIEGSVRSLSEDAAGIDVSEPDRVPDEFSLIIPGDDFDARCRVVSRSGSRIEVVFA